MASTISTWYHNQYSTWNRTRRMQASPYLARPETQTSRVTRAASRTDGQPGDAVINMGDLLPPSSIQASNKKKQDTLFGPSIGVVNPGPEWTEQKLERSEKAQLQDALTPELVRSWVEKSKEATQPTTTLQALVNLKRPSLRLSPISQDDSDDPIQSQHHGLEFQFDCDAPKCGISLHIITTPPKDSHTSTSSTHLVDVFHTAVDGGFGRMLKFEEGATLELDKYDASAQPSLPPSPASDPPAPTSTPNPADGPAPSESAVEPGLHHKKRFTLRIRKRTHPHAAEDANRVSVAGPALQVVDAETNGSGNGNTISGSGSGKGAREKDEEGVRVVIKLEALDANEHTLVSPNSQATYLHVVRLGPAPAASTPDTRPWVVRVVKREATIGPHTFHLHEIYGLTSHSSPTAQSVTNLHEDPHVYPPTAGAAAEDDPTSECLLCLSSPREVVLLPCRHLVACKECAVNMVEFGAGGQLVHGDDAGANAGDLGANAGGTGPAIEAAGESSGANEGEPNPTPAPVTTPAPRPTNPRRKRKAKGWFCPVCRQPYTSLLRISTTAPAGKVKIAGETEEGGGGNTTPGPLSTTAPAPAPAGQAQTQRPGFLRVISNAAARVTGSDISTNNSSGNGNTVRQGAVTAV